MHRQAAAGTACRTLALVIAIGAVPGPAMGNEHGPRRSPGAADATPWWNRQKIRFGWSQWAHIYHRHARSALSTEDLMRNLARVGMTVFAEHSHEYDLERARLARKHGLRYFATAYICELPRHARGARRAIDEKGAEAHHCPLDTTLYERWFLDYALEAARTGLVDGLHMDWEPYPDQSGPRGVQVACLCDSCFGAYVAGDPPAAGIPPAQRHAWLESRSRLADYAARLEEATAAMFSAFAARAHEVKPDFVFSAYGGYSANLPAQRWRMYGVARGLSTVAVPFLVLDHRHYWDDHTRPWWYSFYDYNRSLGLKTIGGTWDNSMFGGRPDMAVSAAQCLYDLGINMDGHWLWLEQDPAPEVYRAWEIANRRLAATEAKVGDFLFKGEQDIRFVTVVEWRGDPGLERAIIQRSFHLGDEHLAHVSNVDADRSVTVRLRFPRLAPQSTWIVRDALADLVVVPDADTPVWTARRLLRGLQLSLARRGEVWLKLSPATQAFRPEAGRTVVTGTIKTMPDHPD